MLKKQKINILFSVIFLFAIFFIPKTEIYARNDEPSKNQPLYESPDYIANSKGYEDINIHKTSSKKTTIKKVDESESYKTLYWYARYSEIDSNNSNKGY